MSQIPYLGLGAILLACAQLMACSSSPARLTSSERIPAADAELKTEAGDNNNTRVNLTVKHLASPEKINPQATTYVVWVQSLEAGRQPGSTPSVENLGALKVDKDLNGTLSTVTPFHNFDLFVTAEPSGQVTEPTGERLLWTQVSK